MAGGGAAAPATGDVCRGGRSPHTGTARDVSVTPHPAAPRAPLREASGGRMRPGRVMAAVVRSGRIAQRAVGRELGAVGPRPWPGRRARLGTCGLGCGRRWAASVRALAGTRPEGVDASRRGVPERPYPPVHGVGKARHRSRGGGRVAARRRGRGPEPGADVRAPGTARRGRPVRRYGDGVARAHPPSPGRRSPIRRRPGPACRRPPPSAAAAMSPAASRIGATRPNGRP